MSRSHRTASPNAPSGGAFLRLLAAGALFLLCLGLKTLFPAETVQYQQQLSSLLTASTDFPAAFSKLGHRLEAGEDIMGAVGDWCVTVFSPEPLVIEEEEE